MATEIADSIIQKLYDLAVDVVVPKLVKGDQILRRRIPVIFCTTILCPLVLVLAATGYIHLYEKYFETKVEIEHSCEVSKSIQAKIMFIIWTLGSISWAFCHKIGFICPIIQRQTEKILSADFETFIFQRNSEDSQNQFNSDKSDQVQDSNCQPVIRKKFRLSKLPEHYVSSKMYKEDKQASHYLSCVSSKVEPTEENFEEEHLQNKVNYPCMLDGLLKLIQMEDPYPELKIKVYHVGNDQRFMTVKTSKNTRGLKDTCRGSNKFCFTIPHADISFGEVIQALSEENIYTIRHLEEVDNSDYVFNFNEGFQKAIGNCDQSPNTTKMCTFGAHIKGTMPSSTFDKTREYQMSILDTLKKISHNLGILISSYVIDQFGDQIYNFKIYYDQFGLLVLEFNIKELSIEKSLEERKLDDSISLELILSDCESIAEEGSCPEIAQTYNTIITHRTLFPSKPAIKQSKTVKLSSLKTPTTHPSSPLKSHTGHLLLPS
ncbi:unnamed protein product [Moneuplotes crassus]|uniref:Uncharacterized protein n=1 Tax=Euplotes crassus TaxID=5936 RepID=A0AAD1Y217_EUPCR|nr:unnamed protein product [Moneuplotes crassus]